MFHGPAIAHRDQTDDGGHQHEKCQGDPDHLPKPSLSLETETNQEQPGRQPDLTLPEPGEPDSMQHWELIAGAWEVVPRSL